MQERLEHRYGISDPVLALTFDDGPSEWTDAVLDRLLGDGQTATFFVVGCAIDSQERIETLRRTVASGCEVGNHTRSHPMLRSLSEADIHAEIAETNALIAEVTNRDPVYWRAPGFHSDQRVRDVVRPFGLREIGCSIDPEDYAHGSTAERIASAVIGHPGLRPGAIVDLHDGRAPTDGDTTAPTRQATVEAVDLLVAALSARGLRSVTISELLAAR